MARAATGDGPSGTEERGNPSGVVPRTWPWEPPRDLKLSSHPKSRHCRGPSGRLSLDLPPTPPRAFLSLGPKSIPHLIPSPPNHFHHLSHSPSKAHPSKPRFFFLPFGFLLFTSRVWFILQWLFHIYSYSFYYFS